MSLIKFPLKVLKPVQKHLKQEEAKLNKRKQDLEAEDPFKDEGRVNDNASVDTDVKEKVGHERVAALKTEVEKTLIRVRKALTRIKLGKYGLCDRCKRMINTDRLAIDPAADLCIKCASKVKA
jgi:DnaK suppressor protein